MWLGSSSFREKANIVNENKKIEQSVMGKKNQKLKNTDFKRQISKFNKTDENVVVNDITYSNIPPISTLKNLLHGEKRGSNQGW